MSWQTNQQKHILSTNTNDAPLFGSGIEKAIPYQISDTFAIKAKEDGKITTIDIDNGLLVVEYKNGKKDVFDISRQLAKNSGGGFFLAQDFEVLFKEGQSFKKNDILAKNNKYFKGTNQGDISYVIGKLSKVALAPSDGTLMT